MARRTYQEREDDLHNPRYDIGSAQLTKFRKLARHGLNTLSRAEIENYADAVEQAVLASQRAAVMGTREVVFKAGCASGTFHNNGADVIKAVLHQQRAALAACPSQERRARTPNQWQAMYDEAMAQKRHRQNLIDAATKSGHLIVIAA